MPVDGVETTTPSRITPKILELCDKIGAKTKPVFVPVVPKPGAIIDECFENVKQLVDREGGELVLGWTIWEFPFVMLEAELHAVCLDDKKRLRDITPKSQRENQILFLPDPNATWDFDSPTHQEDNIRLPLTDHPLVIEWIAAAEEFSRLMRLFPRGEIDLTLNPSLSRALNNKVWLQERVKKEYLAQLHKPSRNGPCPCGSGKKYKRCCGGR